MIKKGVDLSKLKPPMVLAVMFAHDLWKKHGYKLEITCGAEGKHIPGSLHPKGLAVDFNVNRTFPTEGQARLLAQELQTALGTQFQVIYERDEFKDGVQIKHRHIHVEFQPNGNTKK